MTQNPRIADDDESERDDVRDGDRVDGRRPTGSDARPRLAAVDVVRSAAVDVRYAAVVDVDDVIDDVVVDGERYGQGQRR